MDHNSEGPNERPRQGRFIKEVDPLDMDYRTYASRVEAYNQHLQREISDIVEGLWDGTPEHFAVATSGSDGRFEKGPQSKMEVMLLHNRDFDPSEADIAVNKLIVARPGTFWNFNEVKPVGNPASPVSAYRGEIRELYPTRLFDAELLGGNPDVFLEALEQQEDELVTPGLGAECESAMNQRRRNSLHIMKHGSKNFRGRELVHFDLDKGLSFYTNPHLTEPGAGSFKFGPLRATQYRLALDLIRMYQSVHAKGGELPFTLDEMPHNIPRRLFWIEAGGFTSRPKSEIASLADNYCFFMHEYHKSQWNYLKSGNPVTEFNAAEVRARLNDTVYLLDKPIIELPR